MWNRSSTYERFYSNFWKKDIIIKERKVKGQIRKIASQKKYPRENLPKVWVYTNHVIFLKKFSRLQKFYFLVKEYMDGYIWLSLKEHFLQAFLPIFFSSGKEKIQREKNSAETQSMKIQEKSGEIPACKNVGKIMQNVGSRRLKPKSAKLTC